MFPHLVPSPVAFSRSQRARHSSAWPRAFATNTRNLHLNHARYDGARQVTVYVPPDPPKAIVFSGDGRGIAKWGRWLEKTDVPSTMIVGVHRLTDETLRLRGTREVLRRAGTEEPFFLGNARRWADALRDAGADVVKKERAGSHGGAFWREEFPLMVTWAFGR